MTLKFSFFYKHSNKDYFLGLLQKVANAHSVEIRAEIRDELLCVFASAENAENLGKFADTLESEIPLSLYFRLKSVELYEKPLSAEKVAQNLENIFSVSEINAIKNPRDSRFCDIFGDSTRSVESSKNQSARSANPCKSFCYFWLSPKVESPLPLNSNSSIARRGSGAEGATLLRKEKGETKKSNNDYFANNYKKLDSPNSLKNALTNLCDSLQKGQGITLSTSKGNISLSTKSDDFDFILANDISTISLYTRASADELNALASFEKPFISLNIKEVFAREVGAKNALFILPYDIILCCISSILLKREIAFVYGKKIDSANLNLVYDSTHKSDFFEIVMGQNGYFLSKNFLDLSANPSGKKLLNLWDFLDFSFDNFKGESDSTQNSDIFIAYLSSKNPTHLANLRTKTQILKIAFDKNPKNILQKITTLENGDKLIANFAREFEGRFRAIQSLDSTPQWTQNIMDIFECAAMIFGCERDKNAIFDLANNYLREIGPKIDFKNVKYKIDCHDFTQSVESRNDESTHSTQNTNSSIVSEKSGLRSHEQGNKTKSLLTKRVASLHDLSPQDEFALFYDESRTIRSIISFTLAGSEPEVIAFGIIESLVDYLILIFRDAQKRFGIKNIGIIGDMFANKIFFDKITQKIPKDFDLVFPKYLEIR